MAGRFGSLKFYDDDMKKALRGATPKLDRVKLDTSSTNVLGGVARVAGTFAEQMRKANEKKVAKERSKMRSALLRAYMAPKKVFDPTAGEAPIMDDDAPEEMPEVSQYDDAEAAFNEANPSGMEAALRVQSQYVPPESGMFGPGEGAFNNMGGETIDELSLLGYNNRLAEEERERELAETIDAEGRKQANAMELARVGKSERTQDRVTFVDGDNNKFVRNMSNPEEAEEANRMVEAGRWNQLQAGYTSRPSAARQNTAAMTDLRKKLESEDLSPAERKRIETELSDLEINIAQSPDLAAKVAQAKKVGTNVGEQNTKDFFQASAAVSNVKDIDDLISRLQAADESSLGFLAELKQQRDKVFALFGSKDALDKVSDTQIIDALMGAEVFSLIKALGIGARGLDTPAERKFLRQVLTGSIDLNKDTLLEMAAKRRRIQVRNVVNWNKGLGEGRYDRFYESTDILKRPLGVPGPAPGSAPKVNKSNVTQNSNASPVPDAAKESDVTQEMWNSMSPEDRKLFQ
jgi:hypothetical protein